LAWEWVGGVPCPHLSHKMRPLGWCRGGDWDGANWSPHIMRGPVHPSQARAHPPPPSRRLPASAVRRGGLGQARPPTPPPPQGSALVRLAEVLLGPGGVAMGNTPPPQRSGLCDRQLSKLAKRGVSFKSNVLQATSGGTDWERLELAWGNSSSCHQMQKIYHVCWLPGKYYNFRHDGCLVTKNQNRHTLTAAENANCSHPQTRGSFPPIPGNRPPLKT